MANTLLTATTPRYLHQKISKKEGYFVTFANKSGLIYQTHTITSLAQTNPSLFIEKYELVPAYRVFWLAKEQDMAVLTVDADGNLCERDQDPIFDEKALKLVANQLSKVHQLDLFFSKDDIEILATKALMIRDRLTAEVARGNVQNFLNQLEDRDTMISKALFNIQIDPKLAAAMGSSSEDDPWGDQVITIDVEGQVVQPSLPASTDDNEAVIDLNEVEKITLEQATEKVEEPKAKAKAKATKPQAPKQANTKKASDEF